ncbi:MAG: NGG1p interacting factor NIF3 [Patescibacteria group bacterium]|nr:NGG1p interacting factor NIF3 [Patescibacteria group bacterium]
MLTLDEIYKLAIKTGIENDPRDKKTVQKVLVRAKKEFEDLKKEEKEFFDKERLHNPYADSRIYFGDENKKIKKLLAGVDIDTGEMLLAKELGVDAVMSHHPEGIALARIYDVMDLQVDMLADLGVPINVAEALYDIRISELSKSLSGANHYQSIDAARLLKIPFFGVHTPCDNLCYQFLRKEVERKKPEYVSDLLKLIKEIPEYREATKMGAGPMLFAGNPKRRCGKIVFTEITGGTSGSKDIYKWLAGQGVGTIVGMHMSKEFREEAEKYHINVVIAGHMSSDSLGLNLFFDELEKKGIEVITCSGIIRVKRNGKK